MLHENLRFNFKTFDDYKEFIIKIFEENDFMYNDSYKDEIDFYYDGNIIDYYNEDDFDDYDDWADYTYDATMELEYEVERILRNIYQKFGISCIRKEMLGESYCEDYDKITLYINEDGWF